MKKNLDGEIANVLILVNGHFFFCAILKGFFELPNVLKIKKFWIITL